jgi:hypothetical protein
MEIPSVLVELDYISNPSRERKLRKSAYQEKLATALFDGSLSFFKKMGRLKLENEGRGAVSTSRSDIPEKTGEHSSLLAISGDYSL